LPEAKALLPFADGKPMDGLAFHLSIPAYNFVTGREAKFDDLLVYLKTDDLKNFSNSDITSQNLIDDSVVLLNHDRIEAKTIKKDGRWPTSQSPIRRRPRLAKTSPKKSDSGIHRNQSARNSKQPATHSCPSAKHC